MQSPPLVRVLVEPPARCGFTGCITLRAAGGGTVAALVGDVLKSIARKSGATNFDEAEFALVVDGQEVVSVATCFGPKVVQLVRKTGSTSDPASEVQKKMVVSPPKTTRRASVEAEELKGKLDALIHTETPTEPLEEEKWLEFGKDKKETLKRISKLEQQLETLQNISVLTSELVNLEHERLGQLRASSEALQRSNMQGISWLSAGQLLVSGLVLHALFLHLVFWLWDKVEGMCGEHSVFVFVAVGVVAATIFYRTGRGELERMQSLARTSSQPLTRGAAAPSVHQSTRGEEQTRALAFVPALRSRLPPCDLKDKDLVRFLLARELNMDKTVTLVTEYLQWLSVTSPLSIPSVEVAQSFNSGKAFCYGMDKQRRPCVVVFARLHDKKLPLTETDRFQARVLAPVCQLIESGGFYADEFVAIFDFAEFGLANFDVGALTKIISNLDKHYCEQLGKLYLINASTLFFALWRLILPFVPERTKSKILIFKSGQDFKSELLRDFEPSQLLIQHGGTSSFAYDPATYIGPVIIR